ncbi:VOC family protein [Paenarthrobacter ilicis]|uniref:VOC domain-containing protein n=1 Tax=Paenarthrobacter ilicis TaxID=43665 RepID=A0ABX0TJ61_9MICC|nr:putative enzyme related to lactoylglutathione lyase [Paenarthrobacter ilicis]NIJ02532.1 hypothetical protein [Paenarthrobacter ilicis]
MSTRISSWPAATPMRVDLETDDPAAARSFYRKLFGWDFIPSGAGTGDYSLAHLSGRAVAGIGGRRISGTGSAWTSYLASDDVDSTAGRIIAAGGQVLIQPRDVLDAGRMALATDSVGAVFGVWQAGNHIGAERVNEHGALCWNELHTRDYPAARTFYASVFDVSYQDVSEKDFVYSTFRRPSDGREVGGIHHDTALAGALAGVPDHWKAWFASDHVDGTVARAGELGAMIMSPAAESPLGRMAVIRGPQGETFGVIDAPRTKD